MNHSDKLYQNIINNLCDGIYFVDNERKILIWNKAAEEITGYKANEVMGHYCQDNLLNHIDKTGAQLCLGGCPLHATIQDGVQREAEVFLRHKKGHRIPVLVKVIPIYEDGKVSGAVEIFTNNSTRTYEDDLISNLTKLVMTDQLTGLSNRRHTENFLEAKLSEYKRFGVSFCVLFLDLDNFSMCNNKYGHKVGDAILTNIASSFKYNVRESDIMGRWGGEEFVGIFEAQTLEDSKVIAEKIRLLVEGTEIKVGDEVIGVTASVGAALVNPEDTLETLIKRADSLMYNSKQNGKNCSTVSDV